MIIKFARSVLNGSEASSWKDLSTTFVPVQPPFHLAGEVASLGAALIWAWSLSAWRKFGDGVSPYFLSLFKTTVAFALMALTAFATWTPCPAFTSAVLVLVVSGIVGFVIGDTTMYAALSRLGAQMTAATQSLSPPIAALVAMAILGERLSLREALGMLLCVTGITFVVYFSSGERAGIGRIERKKLVNGLCFASVSAVSQAIVVVMQRQAFQDVDLLWGNMFRLAPPAIILFLFHAVYSRRFPVETLRWERKRTSGLCMASFAGTFIGSLLLAAGTRYTKAGVAAVLTSSYPIWIIPIAVFYLHEKTNVWRIVGTVVAIAGIGIMVVPI